jgi:DNA repair exonuclease SbcCD nuclease subunit
MTSLEDDVALKLLHTADWHLGHRFPGFDDGDEKLLMRARLQVLERIFGIADQYGVDAVLCAGDLFNEPAPDDDWWRAAAERLGRTRPGRPIFLLPGNHDPIEPNSVYADGSKFRQLLPAWVHIVDRDDFSYPLNDVSILHARPCRSKAGQQDHALALPAREAGDPRIRIGMVHGSTFDAAGCQTNFPIAKEAAKQRGFDYLAIGDTHSFRVVPPGAIPPVVYPGAPEATCFDEPDAGSVVVVFVNRRRKVRLRPERVAHWTWRDETISTLDDLRGLLADSKLATTVLRLAVDLELTAPELEDAEKMLVALKGTSAQPGRAGILQIARRNLVLDSRGIEESLGTLPDVLRSTVTRLKGLEGTEQAEVARRALFHLYRLVRNAESS